VRTVLLDNEAVQSLASITHHKHRGVLAHLEGVVSRRKRGRIVETVVPTSVRVEAGWDRTQPEAAALNRFRITDQRLDAQTANIAANLIARRVATSVADAHIGATVQRLNTGDIVVITSDPQDITAVCSPTAVTIVSI